MHADKDQAFAFICVHPRLSAVENDTWRIGIFLGRNGAYEIVDIRRVISNASNEQSSSCGENEVAIYGLYSRVERREYREYECIAGEVGWQAIVRQPSEKMTTQKRS